MQINKSNFIFISTLFITPFLLHSIGIASSWALGFVVSFIILFTFLLKDEIKIIYDKNIVIIINLIFIISTFRSPLSINTEILNESLIKILCINMLIFFAYALNSYIRNLTIKGSIIFAERFIILCLSLGIIFNILNFDLFFNQLALNRRFFYFVEFSHLSIALSPLYILCGIYSNKTKLIIIFLLSCTSLFLYQNLTFIIVLLFYSYFIFRRLFKNKLYLTSLATLILFFSAVFILFGSEYYSQRIDFTGGNVSLLILLDRINKSIFTLTQGPLFGYGFNRADEINVFLQNTLFKTNPVLDAILEYDENRFSFSGGVAYKFIVENGLFGTLFISVFYVNLLKDFFKIQLKKFSEISFYEFIYSSLFLCTSLQFFFRGSGYLSTGSIFFFVSIQISKIINQKKNVLH